METKWQLRSNISKANKQLKSSGKYVSQLQLNINNLTMHIKSRLAVNLHSSVFIILEIENVNELSASSF